MAHSQFPTDTASPPLAAPPPAAASATAPGGAPVHAAARSADVVRAGEAETLLQGALGADLLAGPARTGGAASFVVHTLEPRAFGAPRHTHRHEDEYSYVLAGTVGVEIDATTVVAQAGDLVCKPRGVPHAFWNAGDEPARLLEVITPSGFERYFVRLAELFAEGDPPDLDALGTIAADFGLDVDPTSVPRLAQTHGLVLQ